MGTFPTRRRTWARVSTIVISNREPSEWLTMTRDALLAQSAVEPAHLQSSPLIIEGPSTVNATPTSVPPEVVPWSWQHVVTSRWQATSTSRSVCGPKPRPRSRDPHPHLQNDGAARLKGQGTVVGARRGPQVTLGPLRALVSTFSAANVVGWARRDVGGAGWRWPGLAAQDFRCGGHRGNSCALLGARAIRTCPYRTGRSLIRRDRDQSGNRTSSGGSISQFSRTSLMMSASCPGGNPSAKKWSSPRAR